MSMVFCTLHRECCSTDMQEEFDKMLAEKNGVSGRQEVGASSPAEKSELAPSLTTADKTMARKKKQYNRYKELATTPTGTPANSPPAIKVRRGLKPCIVCGKQFFALNPDKENYCSGDCVRKSNIENVNRTEAEQPTKVASPSADKEGNLF